MFEFNVNFDIASLFFLIVICWQFFSSRRFPSRSNRLFGGVLIIAMGSIALDIMGSASIKNLSESTIAVAYVINTLYFILQIILPSAIAVYLLAIISERTTIKQRVFWILSVPVIVLGVLMIASMPSGGMFTISLADGYQRGPLGFITYLACGIYILLGVVLSIRYRKYLTGKEIISFLVLVLSLIISMLLQLVFSDLMLVGIGTSLAFMIMFFLIQNPRDLVDTDTGLFNRDALAILARDALNKSKTVQFAGIEMAGVRMVNNIYGFGKGDRLVKEVAQYFSREFKGQLFRVDRNMLLLISTSEAEYIKFLKKAEERLFWSWNIPGEKEYVPIMLSCVHMNHAEKLDGPEEILDIIERAGFENKTDAAAGRMLEVSEEMYSRYVSDAEIEALLKPAMESGESMELYYQPIYDAAEKKVCSAEALLRFRHPEKGLLSPGSFIHLIEQAQFKNRLDELIIRKAFDDIAGGLLERTGITRIHINLSGAGCTTNLGIKRIQELADAVSADLSGVCFEIVESIASIPDNGYASFVEAMKKRNATLALDDFGTGYSNMARIIKLPFDIVKIDRSILAESADIYQDLVTMLLRLKKTIVAEGVETQEEADFVEKCGVSLIQGFFCSSPVSKAELEELCSKQ